MLSDVVKYLRIEKEEKSWVAWLSAAVLFMVVGTVMLGTLLQTFIIKRAGVEYLPYLHVFTAFISIISAWLTLTVLRRLRALNQSIIFIIAGIAGAVVLAVTQSFISHDSSLVAIFAFVGLGIIVGTLAVSNAMTKINVAISDFFNYEQMQRLEPVIGSVATFSVLIAGGLMALLSERIGAEMLYLFVAGFFALTAPCLFMLSRLAKKASLHVIISQPDSEKGSWIGSFGLKRYVKDKDLRKFIVLLGVIIGLSVIFSRIFGYGFSIAASEAFPTESELNAFFGAFTAISSLGGLLFITLIQHVLIRKYGLTNNLYTPPLVVLIGTIAMFVFPVFWVVFTVVYVRDIVIGIQSTAYAAMMEGVSDYQRNQAWSWIDGPIYSIFDIIGSGLLVLVGAWVLPLGTDATIRILALAAAFFLMIRFMLTVRFKKMYPSILSASVMNGDFKTRIRALEAMAELRYMKDHRLGQVLDIIRDEEEPASVRKAALAAIAHIKDPSSLRVVRRFIAHGDPTIRKEAIRTVAAFDYDPEQLYESGFSRHALIDELRKALPDEHQHDIANAILEALVALRDPDIIPFLLERLKDPSPTKRHSVLRSMRDFKDPAIIDIVKPYLDDPSVHVRAQAIIVIWRFEWERKDYLSRHIEGFFAADEESDEYRQGLYLIGALSLRKELVRLKHALDSSHRQTALTAAIALLKLGNGVGGPVLREMMRNGSDEEAFEVTRLVDHPDIPDRQKKLIEGYIHLFHLHYPPDLPVSEPLRVRMNAIPKGCLDGLKSYYLGPDAFVDRQKLEEALHRVDFPPHKGRVVLAGLPNPWREMAAITLLAHGYLVREAGVEETFDESVVVVADVESDRFPSKTVYLADTVDEMTIGRIVKSHYAPSELVTEVEKLSG